MTEDRVIGAMDAVIEDIKAETGLAPSGWIVAKRIAFDMIAAKDKAKDWETKYHELLHRKAIEG